MGHDYHHDAEEHTPAIKKNSNLCCNCSECRSLNSCNCEECSCSTKKVTDNETTKAF